MAATSERRDTTPDAHALIMQRFASMTTSERALVMQDLNDACTALALTGIAAEHGDISDDELRWHLAARRYGKALADQVYGAR